LIYKIKHAVDGSVIARGFSQIKGVVYDETLDPVNMLHFHPYYLP
jgi:hypothetical protein